VYHLYIDEFGDSQVLSSTPSAANNRKQPFVILSGIIINSEYIPILTAEIIDLKKKYFPNAPVSNSHNLTWLQVAIKGANLKKAIINGNRNRKRTFKRFYRDLFVLLNRYDVQLLAKCFVKDLDQQINIEHIYTSCVQNFCEHFQNYLISKTPAALGAVILDSRQHHKDKLVAFSIATQKYKYTRDLYPNLIEVPSFGMDDNHVGLQICDWLVSGIIVPICGLVYVRPFLPNNIFADARSLTKHLAKS